MHPNQPPGGGAGARRLSVTLPAELATRAEAAAAAQDRSVGSLVRLALAAYLPTEA